MLGKRWDMSENGEKTNAPEILNDKRRALYRTHICINPSSSTKRGM